MLRRGFFIVLLGLNAWAGACSIHPPPKAQPARIQLYRATSADQALCKGQSDEKCKVYTAQPAKIAEWLAEIDGTASQKANQWIVTHDPRYGRVTTIRESGALAIAETSDIQTAFEKLDEHLNKSKKPQWMWLGCQFSGITDAAYQLSECRWIKNPSKDLITFQVLSAQDQSLPAGRYEVVSGGTCGGYFINGPKN